MLKKTKGTLDAFYIERMEPDLNSKDELQEVIRDFVYRLV
jgi:hypothetical protein